MIGSPPPVRREPSMTIGRRNLLKGGLAAVGGLVVATGTERPAGWLATQLRYQLGGLNGRYPEVSHFLQYDNTGWIHPDLGGWEEVPYWLRGYADLAHVTGDAGALATTGRWVDGVLATQAPDGFFGPAGLRTALNGHADLWPHM